MKIIYILALLPTLVFAAFPSGSSEEFCLNRARPEFVKSLVTDSMNLMSFKNGGGISGGGVCWWHSRFQRNALYLTFYSPAKPRPESYEIPWLVRRIRNANEVVEIPGFSNFQEFSTFYQNEIQTELEKWQRFEGLRFTWIRGLRGSASVSPEWMKELMDHLYEEVETRNHIAYQKLQMRGITAHAWLVINMTKLDDGYDLEILDSNFPDRTNFYQYKLGDTHLLYGRGRHFTPYLEYVNEMERINSVITDTCTNNISSPFYRVR